MFCKSPQIDKKNNSNINKTKKVKLKSQIDKMNNRKFACDKPNIGQELFIKLIYNDYVH